MLPTAFERLSGRKNTLGVLLAVATGMLVPGFERYTSSLLTPLVIFLVYSSVRGFSLAEADLSALGVPIALSLGLGYVVIPIIGLPIASLLLSDSAVVGLAITLAVPTTAGSAIVWTRFSRGDTQLAAIVSVASLLLAPIVTPLLLLVLVSHRAAVPIQSILVDILLIVIVAALCKGVIPTTTLSERTTEYGSGVAIVLIIYTGVAGTDAAAVSVRTVLTLIVASTTILLLGSTAAYAAGNYCSLGQRRILPIFFTSSFKNLGIALLISTAYSSGSAVLAIVTYYVVEQVTGAAVADIANTRLAKSRSR